MEQESPSKKKRLRQIVQVFLKYRVLQNLSKQQNPVAVREAFEELGPTFIKIGQMLSVRSDLLSEAFTNEFKHLQDNVKSDPFPQVQALLEAEWQQPLTAIFSTFQEVPLASASIGQAHRGTLKDGKEVVVKVQHPGIISAIQVDLDLFEKAIPLIRHIPETNVVDLKSVLHEVRRSLDNETNFLQETKNAQEFYHFNHHWQQIEIPKVYPQWCTRKVIVMDYMEGENLNCLLARKNNEQFFPNRTVKEIKKEVGTLLVENFMKQVFEDGFFHADPHPGNLFLQPLDPNQQNAPFHVKKKVGVLGGVDYSLKWQDEETLPPYRLIFLDFGMMGHLDQTLRSRLADALIALYTQDTQQVGRAVLRLCRRERNFDEVDFYQDLQSFVENYYNMPIKDIDLQKVLAEVITICHDNHLQMHRDITLLIKAFGTLEGVIEALDPQLSMMEVTQPFAQKYFLQQLDLEEEMKKSLLASAKSLRALSQLPDRTLAAVNTLATGKHRLNIEIRHQKQLLDRFDQMINRLVIGIILAAVILGSSLLVVANPQQGGFVHQMGIFGYCIAFLAIVAVAGKYFYDRFRKK
ncbi:AarF/UbiB family protein [Enterococcus sp.]|jgi:ubiquinone biosynthesis protein|uniref:ABC1 kinase family protein n=1 Tax=Enterococcus sp. TaxID=35783 RepID=UPI0025B9C1F7|nr:AarF/UbiB family protein [Enterococcus sp.]